MLKLLLCLILIPMQIIAFAGECDTRYVGGGSTPNAALEALPPLDQDSFGICYAYSATFMYDYWKQSHGSGDPGRSLPMEAALGAATGSYQLGYSHRAGRPKEGERFSSYDLESGDVQDPLVYLIQNGRCNSDSVANFSDPSGVSDVESELRQFYYDFQEYRAAYTGYMNFSVVPGSTWHQAGIVGERIRRCLSQEMHLPLDTLPSADVIATLLHDKNPAKLMHELIYAQCRENRNVMPTLNRPGVVEYSWMDHWTKANPHMPPTSTYRSAIDGVLNRTGAASQPVEISFCASVYRRNYSEPVEREDILGEIANYDCTRHSAVVVARENRGGVCKYLVQNHSGTECNESYAEGVECEGGRLWVPAESLMNATFGFTHLQDRSWPDYFTGTYSN